MENNQAGIHLGVGTAAMVVVAFGAAAFTGHGTAERLAVMVLAVGAGARLIADWRYGAALGVIGYLLYLGFLVNDYGDLAWRGTPSLWEFGPFVLAYAVGVALRARSPHRQNGVKKYGTGVMVVSKPLPDPPKRALSFTPGSQLKEAESGRPRLRPADHRAVRGARADREGS